MLVGVTRQDLSGEGAYELRSDDKKAMAVCRPGVVGSWQMTEHVQRP